MMRKKIVVRSAAAAVLAVAVAATAATLSNSTGRVGSRQSLLANGRLLAPAGRLVTVGNFPTGGAATPDGRFYWALSTGRGFQDIRIVDVAKRKVVQIVPIPGTSGGISMDAHRPIAYVSGVADSSHLDQQRPKLHGRAGDAIHVFSYDPRSGKAKFSRLISVPPPAGLPVPQGLVNVGGLEGPPQEFPPTNTTRVAWPDRLALSPDGKQLLVPLNLVDHAAIVDTASGATRYVAVGHYPYAAAILPDGKTGLVTNETSGTVSVIDLKAGRKTRDITVGANLSHPEAILVDKAGTRAFVTVTNSDKVSVINLATSTVEATLNLVHPTGLGSAPVALALSPDGSRLFVAEEGVDDLVVFAVPKARGAAGFTMIGRIPTADFPADVQVANGSLVYLAAKGLGTGPNPHGPNPTDKRNSDDKINSFSYLPSIVTGSVGLLPLPSDSEIRAMTKRASAQIVPSNAEAAPADTPLRPGGPIKHVFYIVKENRTYDQVLGDLGRGDSDPKLTLFGKKVTPNIHSLVNRFPLLDHLYANSEASIDGHFWSSAAGVSDYVHKNWFQNYGGRGRPYDFTYSVTWPGNGFLFDQAERDAISYFNYGEAIAGVVPFPDKDRSPADTLAVVQKYAHSDLGLGTQTGVGATPAGACYPNDASVETNQVTKQPVYDSTPPAGSPPQAESRYDCFARRFDTQLATSTVPAFNYMVLSNNHTVGTSPGKRTPQAMVADNDYGLGQVVDKISHSSIWNSSAIFVIEDDSQDGPDHVDAHRIPAAVISPFAAKGAVVHTRYDFLSVIRSMELILGMHPLGLFDALATPMYDAFTTKPLNIAPYTAILPTQSRSDLNKASSPSAALSASLDFTKLDQVDQKTLDEILWHSVYGESATPPAPGPNATKEQPSGDGD